MKITVCALGAIKEIELEREPAVGHNITLSIETATEMMGMGTIAGYGRMWDAIAATTGGILEWSVKNIHHYEQEGKTLFFLAKREYIDDYELADIKPE